MLGGLKKQLHNPRIIALSDDQHVTDALARLVDGSYPATAEVLPQATAGSEIADWKPDLIIVQLDDRYDPAARISELTLSCATKVLAIGTTNDVSLYRDVIQSGASDYLLAPLDDTQLAQAIDKVMVPSEPVAQAVEPEKPSVHVIIGARGGVGATSLAVSTAWLASEELKKETALIDLDMQFGSCPLALDLLPGSGLRDALANPDRIDSLFIGSAMINATDTLFVLGAEEALDQHLGVAHGAVETLMDAVTQTFSTSIVELPRHMLEHAENLLLRAVTVTIVCDLSIAGLRDAVRLQERIGMLHDGNIQIAVMQTPKTAQQVSPKELEQGLGRSVTYWLPYDEKSATAATTQGKSIPDVSGVKSAYSKAIMPFAKDVCGITEETKRKKLWRW